MVDIHGKEDLIFHVPYKFPIGTEVYFVPVNSSPGQWWASEIRAA